MGIRKTTMGIHDGSFRVERDSLGGARLACYRHVTDYLGSVRTVYRMGTSWVLTPVQHIAYLPSGAVLANSDGDVQQRMFCGKELQPLHGWKMYDSHARMQYNVLPRFSATDPLCQKYYHLSPYAYCANDPVNMVDPEGKDGYVIINGNRITFYAYIFLYGKGATQDVANQMQDDINHVWGDEFRYKINNNEYIINFNIHVSLYNSTEHWSGLIIDNYNPFSRNNYIQISTTNMRSYVKGGDQGIWRGIGPNKTPLNKKNDHAPHEVGHLLGLEDKYKDMPGGSNPYSGWENNIMGNNQGVVDDRNIQQLLQDLRIEKRLHQTVIEINP